MLTYKLGRRPAVHNRRTMQLAIAMHRHLSALGDAPAASPDWYSAVEKATGGTWYMLGNGPDPSNPTQIPDGVGDCAEVDDSHTLMLRTANTGKIIVPTTAQTLASYSAQTGFSLSDPNSDQGTDETSDCQYLTMTGFLGHKAAATGPLDPSNLNHLRWGVRLFGSVKLGISVTQSMMDAFDAGKPWDADSDTNSLGGHDVPLIATYTDGSGDIVTWAKRQHVTAAWLASNFYMTEAHILAFSDFLLATGLSPDGFDLTAMVGDLQQIETQQAA